MDTEKLQRFADLLQTAQREEQARRYPNIVTQPETRVVLGKRYAKIDISHSGSWSGLSGAAYRA